MKFSHHWIQTFFAETLPTPEVLADKITFHSSEIEEVISLSQDTVLDVKVLPDKSAWLMSHRGLAKEISVILNVPLKKDPFLTEVNFTNSDKISINRASDTCDFYAAALIEGVKVGPSPLWLKESLEAIGQRSINNIVDATNFVMFELGQPLHAFDADKLSKEGGVLKIGIRKAKAGESIVTLTGESYNLNIDDTVITDDYTERAIGIAGVKGGKFAAVENTTTSILLESAHFERVAVRNTAKQLKLQTDASKRFENGIGVGVSKIALNRVVEVILEVAGGKLVGQVADGNDVVVREPVSCTLKKINSILGLELKQAEVSAIIERFGYAYTWKENVISVTPSFERDDLIMAEDLVEEIGRMHGLHNIVSIPPATQIVGEFNKRHYYAELIRERLVGLGFSEIFSSSFRSNDIVKLENALASDKGCLRSSLVENIKEARDKNISHRDLLGVTAIKIFEIGTVFSASDEEFRVVLAVQTGTSYKQKVDDSLLKEALEAIVDVLGTEPVMLTNSDGIAEFSLDLLLPDLPEVEKYATVIKKPEIKYRPFSVYPAIARDIAMWVDSKTTASVVMGVIENTAGPLLYRTTLFDEFTKDGKISYAFRLVFQSTEKTLTDDEVQSYMELIYKNVQNQGWETR